MRLRQYLLLALLLVIGISLFSVAQGPPGTLVNNQFIGGQTTNGVVRRLIGLSNGGVVSLDPDAVGSTMGGTLSVTGVATIPSLTFTTLTGTITAANLPSNLKTGYIPLDLFTARIISGNAIQNLTEAGVPDGNTNPSIARINGATDKLGRTIWAAGSAAEIQFTTIAPPADFDGTAAWSVNVLAAMAGATDTPTITTVASVGVGINNSSSTAAITGTTIAKYTASKSITTVNATDPIAVSLTPGTHATDALYVVVCVRGVAGVYEEKLMTKTIQVFKDQTVTLNDLLKSDADDVVLIGTCAKEFLLSVVQPVTLPNHCGYDDIHNRLGEIDHLIASKYRADLNGKPNSVGHAIGRCFFYHFGPYVLDLTDSALGDSLSDSARG